MTYPAMACIAMAYTAIAYVVVAYAAMAYIVMAYAVIACVVMAHQRPRHCISGSMSACGGSRASVPKLLFLLMNGELRSLGLPSHAMHGRGPAWLWP